MKAARIDIKDGEVRIENHDLHIQVNRTSDFNGSLFKISIRTSSDNDGGGEGCCPEIERFRVGHLMGKLCMIFGLVIEILGDFWGICEFRV